MPKERTHKQFWLTACLPSHMQNEQSLEQYKDSANRPHPYLHFGSHVSPRKLVPPLPANQNAISSPPHHQLCKSSGLSLWASCGSLATQGTPDQLASGWGAPGHLFWPPGFWPSRCWPRSLLPLYCCRPCSSLPCFAFLLELSINKLLAH